MKKIFILFIILISFEQIITFKCGADQLKLKPKGIDSSKFSNKRRLSSNYQPIKILADYSNLNTGNGISSDVVDKTKELIDETCKDFSKFLSVVPIASKSQLTENEIKSYCEIDNIGNDFQNYFLFNDLVVFPYFDSTLGSSTLAAAAMCIYLSSNYRPIYGVVAINPNLSFNKKNTDLYMKNLFLHEFTHILVFTPDLFSSLGMMTTRIFDGSFVSFVNSPKVLTVARQHFNCTSLNGVPLENQGSTGSVGAHWEARYMLGDYMISSDYCDNVMSDITLALFEDSGLYKVNYYSGGLFKFGKNMGCSFFNKKCIEGGSTDFKEEFCTNSNQYFCSRTKLTKGQCIITEAVDTIPKRYRYFSDDDLGGFPSANYCPVSNVYKQENDYYPGSCAVGTSSLSAEYGEEIGKESFCFISSLIPSNSKLSNIERAICYKVECDNEKMQIIVNIGNNKVQCPTEGGNIDNPTGFKGSIVCPKFYEICGQEMENEGDVCNSMFDCFDKKAETNINTISFFPEEGYEFVKESKDYNLIFNFNLILLFIILCI